METPNHAAKKDDNFGTLVGVNKSGMGMYSKIRSLSSLQFSRRGGSEGENKDSQRQTTTGKQGETQQRQGQAGEHTTSRQKQRKRKRGRGEGEKAHGIQPWQAEEPKRKAELAAKPKHPAAR